ncbi:AraC family transcriptional regulator [Roseococcus sp. SYP-B2431]|uniref:AraC family transcriptional regulator n=1 Tax=Roseococcus sp. SYP-B2431 TaxID=2496640 RepID=UPI00104084D6|nr:helix-turn-helix transcriptional regulator [Roseococcus sp. SYP-B2431]TCH97434.1 AraC family transcriptional regulator [Roseococcus sp. SYP-B2431]
MSRICHNPRTIAQEQVDRPLAAFARDYGEGERTGWHDHGRAQLLYAIEGVMRVDTPGALFVVPPGRALWVPAEMSHEVRSQGRVAMRALFFRADAARVGEAVPAVLGVSALLRELILAACAEPLEWDEAGRGGHLAALIAEEVARAPRLPFGVPALRDARLKRLAEALATQPASALTLDEWAGRCGASARTLARLFHAETGMGFARWRQTLRLAEAAALLAQGATPARAAAAVGYASAPAFGAAFRAAFGITPGEAR